ncbi:MAG: hypothetical protein ACQEQO_07715 [Thermodesulfobacteriota bacterium]
MNGGVSDLFGNFGFVDAASKTAKNTSNGRYESEAFSGSATAVGGSSLLNPSDGQSGTVIFAISISGIFYSADVSTDLSSIGDKIKVAGTSTSGT